MQKPLKPDNDQPALVVKIMKRSSSRIAQKKQNNWYQNVQKTQIMNQQEIDKDMALIRRQLTEIQQMKNRIYSLQADLRVMVKLQEKISQKITQPILPLPKEVKSQFYDEDQSAQPQRPQQ